jgi:probable F420-dependent oxidoreductase
VGDAPELSIGLSSFGAWLDDHGGWRRLVDLARVADDAGVDRLVVVDHVVMGERTDRYRWGRFPTTPEDDWPEPLTLLAGMAAVTERVRLATGILIASLRRPALLAKTAATLDRVADGRLELGVGIGWQREEYEAAGLDWAERGRLLTDTLAACRVLWSEESASVDLPTIRFDGIHCNPKPAQPDGVPFWVAGTLAPRNLARLVDHGSGWIPIMGASLADIATGVETVRSALVDAGRDPSGFGVQGPLPVVKSADGRPDLAATMAGAPALVGAGVTAVHVGMGAFCRDPDAAPAFFAEVVERFHSEVT